MGCTWTMRILLVSALFVGELLTPIQGHKNVLATQLQIAAFRGGRKPWPSITSVFRPRQKQSQESYYPYYNSYGQNEICQEIVAENCAPHAEAFLSGCQGSNIDIAGCCEVGRSLTQCSSSLFVDGYCEPQEILEIASTLGLFLLENCLNVPVEGCQAVETKDCDKTIQDIFPACLDPSQEECCRTVDAVRPCIESSVSALVCYNDLTGVVAGAVLQQLDAIPACTDLQNLIPPDFCFTSVFAPCKEAMQTLAEATQNAGLEGICAARNGLFECVMSEMDKEQKCNENDKAIVTETMNGVDETCAQLPLIQSSLPDVNGQDTYDAGQEDPNIDGDANDNITDTISPTPNSTSIDIQTTDAACFPARATVLLSDGTTTSMADLNVGDQVLAAPGVYSEVFFFGHESRHKKTTFIELSAGDATLQISPDHYIKSLGGLIAARDVSTGTVLYLNDGTLARVTGIETRQLEGLYNPHTLSGEIIVDGVQVSCFTRNFHPTIGALLLVPLKAAHLLGLSVPSLGEDSWGHRLLDAPTFVKS